MSPRKSGTNRNTTNAGSFELDELRTFLRLSVEEMETVAAAFADKLNTAGGPVVFLFPTKGWSAIDPHPGNMFSPEKIAAFLKVFREKS